jgi:hypothetical protein
VGAAEPHPDGHLVLGRDDVLDVRLEVGEGAQHQLEALPPRLAPVLGFGQFSQVDDEVRGGESQALAHVTGVERLEPGPHQLGVRGGRGDLRSHRVFSCASSRDWWLIE